MVTMLTVESSRHNVEIRQSIIVVVHKRRSHAFGRQSKGRRFNDIKGSLIID